MKSQKSPLIDRIKSLVTEVDPSADVILYGSRARGDNNPDSDWDILILVDTDVDLAYERTFRHKLYDLELETGETFSVFVYNKSDWNSRHWMTPLYQNISREGLRI
jgi:predicted nucleotidyltransferase